MVGKVVERGQVPHGSVGVARVGQAGVGVPQLVEEGVHHGVNGRQSLGRCVLEQLGDEVDCVVVSLAEHLSRVSDDY
jgi:hypothetical protein